MFMVDIYTVMTLYRYKQTQQESKTLQIVNQELSKLDNMISSEISILRERIEEANRQYNAARCVVCVCVCVCACVCVLCLCVTVFVSICVCTFT